MIQIFGQKASDFNKNQDTILTYVQIQIHKNSCFIEFVLAYSKKNLILYKIIIIWIMMKKIYVHYNDEDFSLDSEINIGRDESSTIFINDTYISRRHCIVRRESKTEISVEDNSSTNGTYLLLSDGNLIEISKKLIFSSLEQLCPLKILLSQKIEIEFSYPSFTTIGIKKRTEPVSIIVKKPDELSFQNIQIVADIYPNAAAVMLRRMLEELLKKKVQLSYEENKDLFNIIQKIKTDFKLNDGYHRNMESIRKLGNEGAHNGNVSRDAINKHINLLKGIQSILK